MTVVELKIIFLNCLGWKHEANNEVSGLSRGLGQYEDCSV